MGKRQSHHLSQNRNQMHFLSRYFYSSKHTLLLMSKVCLFQTLQLEWWFLSLKVISNNPHPLFIFKTFFPYYSSPSLLSFIPFPFPTCLPQFSSFPFLVAIEPFYVSLPSFELTMQPVIASITTPSPSGRFQITTQQWKCLPAPVV